MSATIARRRPHAAARGPGPLAALLCAALLLPLAAGAADTARAAGADAFPASDVVLLVDASAGMGLPTDLPADFPHRARYTGEIAQILEAFYTQERQSVSGGTGTAAPTPPPTLQQRAQAARWLAELVAFQGDLNAYTRDHQLDPAALTRLAGERRAAAQSLDVLAASGQGGARSRVGLVVFSDTVDAAVPLGADPAPVRAALDSLTVGSGPADLAHGLQAAIDRFASDGPAPSPDARKQIVLLSGSPASPSPQLDALAATARQRGIAVDTVGVGPSPTVVGQDALVSLARGAGGGYIFAPTGDAVVAAAVGYRAYATGRVLARASGSLARGQQASVAEVPVPEGAAALRVTVSDVRSAGGVTGAPAPGSGTGAAGATPTARPAGPGIVAVLVDPTGQSHGSDDPALQRVSVGGQTLLTLASPAPGAWHVELSAPPDAVDPALPYALTGAVDGTSDARPIDLAPAGAGAPPRAAADDPRVRLALWVATGVLAAAILLALILALRGWTRPGTSRAGGCAAGCLVPLLLLLLGGVWAVVRFADVVRFVLGGGP